MNKLFSKNRSVTCITFFILILVFNGCKDEGTPEYVVKKTSDAILIDGKLSEPAWQNANVISGFEYPWNPDRIQPTVFRALHDGEYLYLAYQMVDDIIIAPHAISDEQDLIEQDRVEIYAGPDRSMEKYYCIEMNVNGHQLDYIGRYHRQFDFSWDFDAVEHTGAYAPNGYQVEAAISLDAINDLGVIRDNAFYAGVYRADFHYGADSTVVHVYASWLDPQVEEPDFHVPASLGVFTLEQ